MKDSPVIESRALRGKSLELERFLRSELQGRVVRRGSLLQIEGERPKNVKLILAKFLHDNHLTDYRVRTRKDTIEVVKVQENPGQHQVSDTPSRMETTPGYFPGLSAFAATKFKTPYAYFGAKIPRSMKARGSKRKR